MQLCIHKDVELDYETIIDKGTNKLPRRRIWVNPLERAKHVFLDLMFLIHRSRLWQEIFTIDAKPTLPKSSKNTC